MAAACLLLRSYAYALAVIDGRAAAACYRCKGIAVKWSRAVLIQGPAAIQRGTGKGEKFTQRTISDAHASTRINQSKQPVWPKNC